MRLSTAVRNAMGDGGVDQVDVGAGTAVMEIYTGSGPVTFGDPPAGTLLVSFDLPNPAYGNFAAGVGTLNGLPNDAVGVGAGDAGHARVVNRNGDVAWDTDDVGPDGGGHEVELSTITVSVGLDVSLTACTATMPVGSL